MSLDFMWFALPNTSGFGIVEHHTRNISIFGLSSFIGITDSLILEKITPTFYSEINTIYFSRQVAFFKAEDVYSLIRQHMPEEIVLQLIKNIDLVLWDYFKSKRFLNNGNKHGY